VDRLVCAAKLRPRGRSRRRPDGDRLDLDACVDALAALRSHLPPDPRVYSAEVRPARLAALRGGFSTRMGAALRHARRWLRTQRAERKLLLLVTDGEPSDIDVHDRRYLLYDAKRAVDESRREGIHVHCLSVDPKADAYVERIFGARNYVVVDRLERLPEKLPLLYLRLAR